MSLAKRNRIFSSAASNRKSRKSRRSRLLQPEQLESRQMLAGDFIPAQLHGFKWEDANGNGERDFGEPGLAGVTIYVDSNLNNAFDESEPHAFTMTDDPDTDIDETGLYWLGGVRPGMALVREVVPDGFSETYPDPLACRAIFCTGRAHMLQLEAGDVVQRVDFGNEPIKLSGSVHGRKWLDRNGNGEQDPDERGLAGVTIYLDANLNNALDAGEHTARTSRDNPLTDFDESGNYWMNNVEPGFYIVREVTPEGFEQTFPGQLLCKAIFCNGEGHLLTLEPGQQADELDFGNRRERSSSIHGTKWLDRNGNAERDPDERGLAGVTIYVDVNRNGALDDNEPHTVSMEDIPETDFDEAGMYWLTDLPAGRHVIREVVPEGFTQTYPLRNIIDEPIPIDLVPAVDDLGFQVSPESIAVTLDIGETHTQEVSLTVEPFCVRAFHVNVVATDPDAIFENHTGVVVNGCGGDTSVFEVSVTGIGVPQSFALEFVDEEFGGLLGRIPVAIAATLGGAHHVVLEPGSSVEGIDFGNRPNAGSVHGTKWLDRNGNGRRENNEPGIAGVTIYSDLNRNGELDEGEPRSQTMVDDPSTSADESGRYWLKVRGGKHVIREVIPIGFEQTFPEGRAHELFVEPGSQVEKIDFGNRRVGLGSIHGLKWRDDNGNGLRDSDEQGLPGVRIYVDANRNQRFDRGEANAVSMQDEPLTRVNEAGRYWIEGVEPGLHFVREVVPEGFQQTFPGQQPCIDVGCVGHGHLVNIQPGDVVEGVDFGNQPTGPGSVHGFKWRDDNGNGIRERSEPGYSNVTVYADLNRNGKLDRGEPSTLTEVDDPATDFDEGGHYWLSLKPGDYLIREVVPKGFSQTFPLAVTPVDDEPGEPIDNPFAMVNPSHIDATLHEGEIFETEVSIQINPQCFEALTVDVIASDPNVEFANQTGTVVNSCSGDTSVFHVSFFGDGLPHQFQLQFTDSEFGGGVLGEIPVSIIAPNGQGAHRVRVRPGQTIEGKDFGNFPLYLPGDTDRLGKVEFADFLRLSAFFGKEGEWTEGDFNGDRRVSFRDFLDLAKNFGKSRPEVLPVAEIAVEARDLVLAAAFGDSNTNDTDDDDDGWLD